MAHKIYKLRQELNAVRHSQETSSTGAPPSGNGGGGGAGGKRETMRIGELKEQLAEAKEAQAMIRSLRSSAAPPNTSAAQRFAGDADDAAAGEERQASETMRNRHRRQGPTVPHSPGSLHPPVAGFTRLHIISLSHHQCLYCIKPRVCTDRVPHK